MESDREGSPPSLFKALVKLLVQMEEKLHIITVGASAGALLPLIIEKVTDKNHDFGMTAGIIGLTVAAVAAIVGALVDRSTSVTVIRASIIGKKIIGINIAHRPKPKEVAISLTYLNHLKRSSASTKAALAITSLMGVVVHLRLRHTDPTFLSVAMACTVTLALIQLKETLLEYRVRKGYFGTTRSEAKALIAFMVTNAKDIDFHDDSGSLRKALTPEKGNAAGSSSIVAPGQVPL
jgi:hypothetical protein